MILKIRSIGDPILRQPARSLSPEELALDSTQQLIRDMRETMHDAPGVGLAAPQVGLPLQLAVIEDREEYLKDLPPAQRAQRERDPVPFQVIVNPVLTFESGPDVEFFEGCLSLPGFTAAVSRSLQVKVECLDEHGQGQLIQARGWHARILQHEIDHLRGTIYSDRMRSRTFTTLENFNRHWKNR